MKTAVAADEPEREPAWVHAATTNGASVATTWPTSLSQPLTTGATTAAYTLVVAR